MGNVVPNVHYLIGRAPRIVVEIDDVVLDDFQSGALLTGLRRGEILEVTLQRPEDSVWTNLTRHPYVLGFGRYKKAYLIKDGNRTFVLKTPCTDIDIEHSLAAISMATRFNESGLVDGQALIKFCCPVVGRIVDSSDPKCLLPSHTPCMIETYLEGDFEKFIRRDSGATLVEHPIIHAFLHFTYAESQAWHSVLASGCKVIWDLQGIHLGHVPAMARRGFHRPTETQQLYYLTDPALVKDWDRAVLLFDMYHPKCTPLCQHFGRASKMGPGVACNPCGAPACRPCLGFGSTLVVANPEEAVTIGPGESQGVIHIR